MAQKLWIWKACERDDGRLIDWECGNRDKATFRRLYERLQRWNARLFCTDQFAVYDTVLRSGGTTRVRIRASFWNATTAASGIGWGPAVGKSIIISRSKARVNRRMALFANLHVNDDAQSEMQRLPSFANQHAPFH